MTEYNFKHNIQIFKLDNGISVITKEVPEVDIVVINFFVKVGSKFEKKEESGISHFLEHMFFRGIRKRAYFENHLDILKVGGLSNSVTWYDWTMYYNVVKSKFFSLAFESLSDSLQNFIFSPEEVKFEKDIIKEEIKTRLDNPIIFSREELMNLVFKNHPYSRRIVGDYESINNINEEMMERYYKTFYVPNNIFVVIVGKFNLMEVLLYLNNKFKNFSPSEKFFIKNRVDENFQGFQEKTFIRDVKESIVNIGFRIPGFKHNDWCILSVIRSMLGDGFNSYLYKTLVNGKKLAGFVSTSQLGLEDQDVFIIKVIPLFPQKTELIKSEVLKILIEMKKKSFTIKELRGFIQQIKLKNIYKYENLQRQSILLGKAAILGNIDYELNFLENIEKITLDDIRRVFNQYFFCNNLSIAEIIPDSIQQEKCDNYNEILMELGISDEKRITDFDKVIYSETKKIPKTKIYKYIIDNGLNLIAKENNSSSLVHLGAYFKHQANYNDSFRKGCINLLLQMLKNETKYFNKEEIYQKLSALGNNHEFKVEHDFSYFIITANFKQLEEAFELFSNLIVYPKFSRDSLEKEKNIAISMLKHQQDFIETYALDQFNRAIFSKHRYAYPILGEIPDIEVTFPEDITNCYMELFQPDNTVIFVSGNIKNEEIKNKVVHLFKDYGRIKPDYYKDSMFLLEKKIKKQEILSRRGKIVFKKNRNQAFIIKGVLAPSIIDPDFIPMKVLSMILSLRVFTYFIYDKAFTSYVGCCYNPLKEAGTIYIYLYVDPKNIEKVDIELESMFNQIITEEVSQKELQNTKDRIIGSLSIQQQTDLDKLKLLGFYEIMGRGIDFNNIYPKLISQVTSKQIQEVAQRYINLDKLLTIIVSP